MRVSIHITTHCRSTHLQHAASPQMGISQSLYLKVTFNICYSSSFSRRGMLISPISYAELWLPVTALQVLSCLVWGNTRRELDSHAFLFFEKLVVNVMYNVVQTGGISLKPSKYCNLWNVERRLEQDGFIIRRRKPVSAGEVLLGFIKGLLTFPLKATGSLIDVYWYFFFFFHWVTQRDEILCVLRGPSSSVDCLLSPHCQCPLWKIPKQERVNTGNSQSKERS